MYELIGRLVVDYVRRRYAAEIRLALGAAVVAVGIAAFLAARRDSGD